ncbi:MAG: response regulator, partial [Verrucomicrobiales bacterium]|nr:response regulator [Verrucomicrobiales bacterium]
MTRSLNILLIEDSEEDTYLIRHHLRRAGLDFFSERVETRRGLTTALQNQSWDLVLCDYSLPCLDSFQAMRIIREHCRVTPIILVSGLIETRTAIKAMQKGAADFILKDDLTRLVPVIEREVSEADEKRKKIEADRKLEETNERLREALEQISNTKGQLVRMERFRALGQMASGIAHDFNNSLTK